MTITTQKRTLIFINLLISCIGTIAGAIGSSVFVWIMTVVGAKSTPIHGLNITFAAMGVVSLIMLVIAVFFVKEKNKN